MKVICFGERTAIDGTQSDTDSSYSPMSVFESDTVMVGWRVLLSEMSGL